MDLNALDRVKRKIVKCGSADLRTLKPIYGSWIRIQGSWRGAALPKEQSIIDSGEDTDHDRDPGFFLENSLFTVAHSLE